MLERQGLAAFDGRFGAGPADLEGHLGDGREFWHRDADARTLARGHCDAIDQFDKLRLVADDGAAIVAVFELSFSIPTATTLGSLPTA